MTPLVDQTSLKYVFADSEITDLAREQARKFGDLTQANEEKANMVADFKSRITSLEGEISNLTRRVSSGYEMRTVKVLTLKFRPTPDEKIRIRLDTGRVVGRFRLMQDERQMSITDEDYTHVGEFVGDDGNPEDSIRLPLYAHEAKLLEEADAAVWEIDAARQIEAAAQ